MCWIHAVQVSFCVATCQPKFVCNVLVRMIVLANLASAGGQPFTHPWLVGTIMDQWVPNLFVMVLLLWTMAVFSFGCCFGKRWHRGPMRTATLPPTSGTMRKASPAKDHSLDLFVSGFGARYHQNRECKGLLKATTEIRKLTQCRVCFSTSKDKSP